MADIFTVVADSARRDILRILLERAVPTGEIRGPSGDVRGELSVSDIVGHLGLSQPTVSKHLKVLREAGLVTVREDGQHRFYRLEYSPLEEIEDWLIPFLSVDFDQAVKNADLEADAGLKEEQRAFASAIGKAFADASQMSHVVKDATAKKWRRNG
ncbi:Helix-turn-helix domain-containing protein [Cryobacterium flavum]|uniref:ArsR family transcriptional regulator n=1 Tax=Cryobacterium flavum TaxID=1424659 RepID=A0A4R8V7B5_9MICO|nr:MULTISPECIES: metalloregulator ArsR/SmtB family transcription factor [Cryobacterium]TFB77831.1 ArsR family transcriptional regulator [Cryobacterium flavum]SDN48064.1 Helix-turn-helix domain-containing protein [Cryobacterium flavum]